MTRSLLISVLVAASAHLHAGQVPATAAAEVPAGAKALYCAYGGISHVPLSPPPGFETQFAVAVVEIDSPTEIANVTVSDFGLIDRAGKMTKFKRVVVVEEFDRARSGTEGEAAYYLNPGGARAWNGTLPAGRIRLRVRVALPERPIAPVRFQLTLGRQMIEGPVNAEWPT
jgi:hypothetical protein